MKNKYLKKSELSEIVHTAKDWLQANTPRVVRPFIESKLGIPLSSIPTSEEEFFTLAKDKAKKKIVSAFVDPIKGNINANKYNDALTYTMPNNPPTNVTGNGRLNSGANTSQGNSILNRATSVISRDRQLSRSIRTAAEINPQQAKAFVQASNIALPKTLAEKDINTVFSDKEIIGLMATSPTAQDLDHKIRAGIVLNRLNKGKI